MTANAREAESLNPSWLREIPTSWRIVALRYLADISTGASDSEDAAEDGAFPFVVRSPELLRSNRYLYDEEAILTAGDGDVGKVFHHLRGKFDVHQRVYALTKFRAVVPRFLYYYFSSQFINVVAYGGAQTTVSSLRRPMFTSFPVAVPPLAQQQAIAEFLDREMAEIDAFIADQEELVDLLAERRRALVAGAVADLDRAPRVPVGRLFRPSKVADRGDLPMLSVYRDWGVVLKSSRSDNVNKTPEDVSRYLHVQPGALVVNKMKAWQGSIAVSSVEGIVSPDYEVASPQRLDVNSAYIHAVLRSPTYVSEYRRRSVGIRPAQWRLYWEELSKVAVPLPPLECQRQFVAVLDSSTSGVQEAIADARETIALSKERRVALISAAVTGQIDVTERKRVLV